jgi:uncharacterized protein YuzE
MNVVYDPHMDILQITFSKTTIEETAQIAPGVVLDYDEDGHVIGMELRKASTFVDSPYVMSYRVGEANVDKPQPSIKEL